MTDMTSYTKLASCPSDDEKHEVIKFDFSSAFSYESTAKFEDSSTDYSSPFKYSDSVTIPGGLSPAKGISKDKETLGYNVKDLMTVW